MWVCGYGNICGEGEDDKVEAQRRTGPEILASGSYLRIKVRSGITCAAEAVDGRDGRRREEDLWTYI